MPKFTRNLKTTISILSIIALLSALPVSNVMASNSSSKNFAELVWGDGNLWSMVAPPSPLPHPGDSHGQEDFYETAPQMPSAGFPVSPQSDHCDHIGIDPAQAHSPCLHDHTLGSVPGDVGYRALWHVYLVLCLHDQPSVIVGDSSCTAETVTGTLLGGGSATLNLASGVNVHGTPTPLTSDAAISSAVSAGVVTIFDTGVTFICPVQAFSG